MFISYKKEQLDAAMKIRRLKYAGHIAKTADGETPKVLLKKVIHVTRRRGRPQDRDDAKIGSQDL